MSTLATLFAAWDESHREFAIALGGTPDGDLWVRAHPKLLSLGELAGHVTYWEASRSDGRGNNLSPEELKIKSPLVDPAFRYYTTNVERSVKLGLGTTDILKEMAGVHEQTKAVLAQIDRDDPYPAFDGATWGQVIEYQIFHIAYHTGQAYSVRHLLGHETEDN
jgi:hypothetical protein